MTPDGKLFNLPKVAEIMNILLIISFLIPLFFLIWALLHFSKPVMEKFFSKPSAQESYAVEGAQRGVFHLLYVLGTWLVLVFFLPMLFFFKKQIAQQEHLSAKIVLLVKLAFLPGIFLLVIFYGARRGYLSWISNLHWPQDEEK